MDIINIKALVDRLGADEAVRKMAAFQLQNQILVLPLNFPVLIKGHYFRARLCRRRRARQTKGADQRGSRKYTRVWTYGLCEAATSSGRRSRVIWTGGRLAD